MRYPYFGLGRWTPAQNDALFARVGALDDALLEADRQVRNAAAAGYSTAAVAAADAQLRALVDEQTRVVAQVNAAADEGTSASLARARAALDALEARIAAFAPFGRPQGQSRVAMIIGVTAGSIAVAGLLAWGLYWLGGRRRRGGS